MADENTATTESKAGAPRNPRKRKGPKQYDEKKYRGKKLKVRFTHLEFPKAGIQFTYRGIGYKLDDNQEISLPIEVIEHLNSLAVPERKYEEDPTTGQMKPGPVTLRHRFSCVPVDLGAFK